MNQFALIILAVFAICSGAFPSPLIAKQTAPAPPNVLFIAVDDLKPILGCYGDEEVITPNIDRLADSGMVFTNAHCQQAVCTASRASLMTGLYPDHTQVWNLKTKIRDITPDVVTLPQYFQQEGYVTQAVGKIFDKRGVDAEHDEASWSLSYQSPDIGTSAQYADPAHYEAVATMKAANPSAMVTLQALRKQGLLPATEAYPANDGDYPDGKIAQLGIDALKQLSQNEKPFFLAIGFLRPHLPFAAPKRYWDLYDGHDFQPSAVSALPAGSPDYAYQDSWELRWSYSNIPGEEIPIPEEQQKRLIHGYYACASYVDALVGKVIAALDKAGLRENTIVVLWGDHGWHLGDHGMWGKHTNYEQATRSPLIVAGPGIVPGYSSAPVEFVDIYPTLCELSNLPIPPALDGISLLPVIRQPDASVRFAAQSQFPREDEETGKNLMGYTYRSDRYRYTEWRDRKTHEVIDRELFDYETDPDEQQNHIADPAYTQVLKTFEGYVAQR